MLQKWLGTVSNYQVRKNYEKIRDLNHCYLHRPHSSSKLSRTKLSVLLGKTAEFTRDYEVSKTWLALISYSVVPNTELNPMSNVITPLTSWWLARLIAPVSILEVIQIFQHVDNVNLAYPFDFKYWVNLLSQGDLFKHNDLVNYTFYSNV